MSPVIAVKYFGFAWLTELGLTEESAARMLAQHGVDWALLQNVIDPLPSSGVEQRLPDAAYDDHRFRDAVRAQGLKIYESTATFFDPRVNAARPELRPRSEHGDEMAMFDWYLGVSPHSRAFLAERVELMEKVVSTFEPDGVFLGFIRFPGFWEGWTPEVPRERIRDYGFAEGSLERFCADTGISLPGGTVAERARTVLAELRESWVAWKVEVVLEAVTALRDAARRARPDVEVMINGLPFAADERGDLGIEIAGQDLGAISGVAEHVESMVYHQIMARPARPWIRDTMLALRSKVRGTLLGSVQTSPAYTTAPHDGLGRSAAWSPEDFTDALRALAAADADGVSVYHWTDLAADQMHAEGRMVRALLDYKAGSL